MSTAEIACSYAALILHDDGIAITADKIATLLKSANLSVEPFWATLFAKLAEKKNIGDLILNAGSSGCAAPAAVAAPAGGAGAGATSPAAAAVEEKKEEPKEESDDDMGFSLFD